MIRSKLLLLMVCLAVLASFHSCTTKKEVPTPVVDTQRLDRLRAELRDLQQKVLGDASVTSSDSLTVAQLQARINALTALYNKRVTYSVIASDYQGTLLPGVIVKVSQGGAVVSQTTAASGVATFANLNGGVITVTADLAGFARLVYKADIRNYNSDQAYSASSDVLMLPVGGTPLADASMFTVNVSLYANYSTLDDTLGGPNYFGDSNISFALPPGPDPFNPTLSYTALTDKPITASLDVNSFLNSTSPPTGFTYNFLNSTNDFGDLYSPGSVLSVAYENANYVVAAAGGTGAYVLKLPATSDDGNTSFVFNLSFTEYAHTFTSYVPGGLGVKIHPPFDPTYSNTQIFRVGTGNQINSQEQGSTSDQKYFYYNSLN